MSRTPSSSSAASPGLRYHFTGPDRPDLTTLVPSLSSGGARTPSSNFSTPMPVPSSVPRTTQRHTATPDHMQQLSEHQIAKLRAENQAKDQALNTLRKQSEESMGVKEEVYRLRAEQSLIERRHKLVEADLSLSNSQLQARNAELEDEAKDLRLRVQSLEGQLEEHKITHTQKVAHLEALSEAMRTDQSRQALSQARFDREASELQRKYKVQLSKLQTQIAERDETMAKLESVLSQETVEKEKLASRCETLSSHLDRREAQLHAVCGVLQEYDNQITVGDSLSSDAIFSIKARLQALVAAAKALPEVQREAEEVQYLRSTAEESTRRIKQLEGELAMRNEEKSNLDAKLLLLQRECDERERRLSSVTCRTIEEAQQEAKSCSEKAQNEAKLRERAELLAQGLAVDLVTFLTPLSATLLRHTGPAGDPAAGATSPATATASRAGERPGDRLRTYGTGRDFSPAALGADRDGRGHSPSAGAGRDGLATRLRFEDHVGTGSPLRAPMLPEVPSALSSDSPLRSVLFELRDAVSHTLQQIWNSQSKNRELQRRLDHHSAHHNATESIQTRNALDLASLRTSLDAALRDKAHSEATIETLTSQLQAANSECSAHENMVQTFVGRLNAAMNNNSGSASDSPASECGGGGGGGGGGASAESVLTRACRLLESASGRSNELLRIAQDAESQLRSVQRELSEHYQDCNTTREARDEIHHRRVFSLASAVVALDASVAAGDRTREELLMQKRVLATQLSQLENRYSRLVKTVSDLSTELQPPSVSRHNLRQSTPPGRRPRRLFTLRAVVIAVICSRRISGLAGGRWATGDTSPDRRPPPASASPRDTWQRRSPRRSPHATSASMAHTDQSLVDAVIAAVGEQAEKLPATAVCARVQACLRPFDLNSPLQSSLLQLLAGTCPLRSTSYEDISVNDVIDAVRKCGARLRELERDRENTQRLLEKANADLDRELVRAGKLEGAVERAQALVACQEAQLQRLREENNNLVPPEAAALLKREMASVDARNKTLMELKESHEAELDRQHEIVADLRHRLREAERLNAGAAQNSAHHQSYVSRELSEREALIMDLRGQLRAQQNQALSAQAARDAASAQCRELENQVTVLQARNKTLQQQHDEVLVELMALRRHRLQPASATKYHHTHSLEDSIHSLNEAHDIAWQHVADIRDRLHSPPIADGLPTSTTSAFAGFAPSSSTSRPAAAAAAASSSPSQTKPPAAAPTATTPPSVGMTPLPSFPSTAGSPGTGASAAIPSVGGGAGVSGSPAKPSATADGASTAPKESTTAMAAEVENTDAQLQRLIMEHNLARARFAQINAKAATT